MKRNIRQTLLAPAVLLLAAAFGLAGCTNDDDFGRLPQGSVPLVLGDVTVAGMKPGTRAAGENASTRAAISENAAGYTGIRKSTFVNGDELALIVSNDGGTTNISVTATLTGGAWVLSEKAYVIPGTTTIRATHAGTEVTAGIKPDALEAATYTLTGQKMTLDLKHAHAMIDITLPAGVTLTSISLAAHNGIADETLTTVVEEEADGSQHYRTIALAGTTATPGTVKSITAVIGGQSYVATLATPLTVEANKKYPVSLTFKENQLTATVGAASLDWGAGAIANVVPAGYTRVIRTPEDLAQFAKDVNDDAAGTGAALANVLQTADLDMSLLKPAAEAGINPLTGSAYTYTAMAEHWISIANNAFFKGTYNGNGYTISNLKGENPLFGSIKGGTLTGIHLRNINLVNEYSFGSLVSGVRDGTINLCSATGTITCKHSSPAGGLIGQLRDNCTVIRCSADVNITATVDDAIIGGLIGDGCPNAKIIGCMASGDVTCTGSSSAAGGLIGIIGGSTVFGCMATGTVTAPDDGTGAFIGRWSTDGHILSCYATGAVAGGAVSDFVGHDSSGIASDTYTDCAYTGTQTNAVTGVASGVAVNNLYSTLTATANTSLADVKTLHWSAADEYTLTPVTNTWCAKHLWKDNGTAAPTLDLAYEGTPLYNSLVPNLLAIPGKAAYYVAPEDAKNASGSVTMTWDEAMAANVCPEGWHVPTKDDFIAMGADDDYRDVAANAAAFLKAFPATRYWSSSMVSTTKAWGIDPEVSYYTFLDDPKTMTYKVRCVRKK